MASPTEVAEPRVTVELPDHPPVMTPKLGRLLLQILRDASDRQNVESPPRGGPSDDRGEPVTNLR